MSSLEVTDGDVLARAREALATSLLEPETLAGIVEEIVAALAAAFPGYATLARVAPGDVRASVGQHVRTILGCLGQGRFPTAGEIAVLSEVAGRRRAQGVPLDQLIRAHHFGARRLLEVALVELDHLVLNQVTHRTLADDAGRIVLGGSGEVASAFVQRYESTTPKTDAHRANEEALAVALAGARDAKSLLGAIGFRLGRFHTVAVFGAADPACGEIELSSMIDELRRILPPGPSTFVAQYHSAVVVVQAHEHSSDAAELATQACRATAPGRLPSCVLAGIGRPEERVAGMSFQDAAEVLELLRKMPSPPRALTFDEAIPSLMFMRSPRHAHAALAAIAPLLGADPGQRAMSLDTLDALLDTDGSIAAVAGALRVSQRTARRRMVTIRRRLDAEPRLARNGLVINLGRRAARLLACDGAFGSSGSTEFAAPLPARCPLSGQNCRENGRFCE